MSAIDVQGVKDYLSNQHDLQIQILESANFANLKYNSYTNDIRGSYDEFSNPTSVHLNCENLMGTIYSKSLTGDIFTLIEFNTDLDFFGALQLVKEVANISDTSCLINPNKKECWSGWYKKFLNKNEREVKIYDNRLLTQFSPYGNWMFVKDKISLQSQKRYNIMYDLYTERVVIPHYDINGNLIGAVGRINEGVENELRYLPILPRFNFPKKFTLFGAYQNKENIKDSTLFIFESEKSVMQLHTKGSSNGVALGGKMLHNEQANIIQSLMPKSIVVCLDEGVEEEHIIKQCKLLKGKYLLANTTIGYLYDRENKYLEKGKKQSPTDLDREEFFKLVKECYVEYDSKS